jgi:hypothetical protein
MASATSPASGVGLGQLDLVEDVEDADDVPGNVLRLVPDLTKPAGMSAALQAEDGFADLRFSLNGSKVSLTPSRTSSPGGGVRS